MTVDDPRPTWPGKPPGNPASVPPGKRTLALLLDGQEVVLTEGDLILGRSPSCDIFIDDMLASRVHAKITVLEGTVILRDLGSANGVWVNSGRIDMPTPLRDGDRVLIGTKELSVFAMRAEPAGVGRRSGPAPRASSETSARPRSSIPQTAARRSPSTVRDFRAQSGASQPAVAPARGTSQEMRARDIQHASRDLPRTEKADAFAQLGMLARRMIDSGRIDGAIRVLAEHMRNVMEGAREGRAVPDDVVQFASEFAMEFAAAKLEAKWVDYVVELHMYARRPMSSELIDDLCALRRKNICWDRDVMLFYKAALQREEPNLPLGQRVLVARILSLGDGD